MSTQMICDGCGEPIEPNTPYEALVTYDVSFNEDGVSVSGVSTEYDFHPGHRPPIGETKPAATGQAESMSGG